MIVKQTEDSIDENIGQVYRTSIYTGKPFYKDDYINDKEPWKNSDSTSIINNGDSLVYDRLPIEVQIFKNEKLGYQILDKKTNSIKRITLLKIGETDVSKTDLGKVDLFSTYKFVPEFEVSELGVRLWKNIDKKGPSSFEWLIEDENKGDFRFREEPEAFDKNTYERVPVATKKSILDTTSYLFKEDFKSALEASKTGLKVDIDFTYSSGGHVFGADFTYSTARSTGEVYNNNTFRVGQNYVSPEFATVVYRSFVKFLTAYINGEILQVNFSCMVSVDASTTDFDVDIVKCDWSSADPISGGIDTAFDACLAGTKDVTWINTNGISLGTRYTSPNMDTTYINKSGYTYYGLRSSRDFANITPTGAEDINLWNSIYGPILHVYWNFSGSVITV